MPYSLAAPIVEWSLARHVLEITLGIFEASRTDRHVAITTRCERPAPLPQGLPANQLDA